MTWTGGILLALIMLLTLSLMTSCADIKHVGPSSSWVGDMGHGAGDGGLSQALAQEVGK